MGLDQYAFKVKEGEDRFEIAYWRKHNRLQGWMEKLWNERGNKEEFNCVDLELGWEDIIQLEQDIANRKLPSTSGFFFGGDSYGDLNENGDYIDLQDDLDFIETAKLALDCGNKVVYHCWW